jgi:hypothetical protein
MRLPMRSHHLTSPQPQRDPPRMTTTTISSSDVIGPDELSDRLDRLYCYHLIMVQWSLAMSGRLTVSARRLLQTDLERDARSHLDTANGLAQRVIQLGGTVTSDPSDLLYRAPIGSFELPDNPADNQAVLAHMDGLIMSALSEYRTLLDLIDATDPVSQQIIQDLLATATVRLEEVRAAAETAPAREPT